MNDKIGSEKGPTVRISDPRRFTAIKDNLLHSCVAEHSSHVAQRRLGQHTFSTVM